MMIFLAERSALASFESIAIATRNLTPNLSLKRCQTAHKTVCQDTVKRRTANEMDFSLAALVVEVDVPRGGN
jgi:hypothetical protein